MQRRTLLKFGLAGLFMAGGVGWLGRQFAKVEVIAGQSVVTDAHRPMLKALASAILDGAAQPDQLDRAVNQFIVASHVLAPEAQAELGQLLNILTNPVGCRLIASLDQDWANTSPGQAAHFLQEFRRHPVPALQPGYHALHDLMFGAWYAEPDTWQAMGYEGPPFKLA
ncbi:MAG: hypothetical protein ACK4FF_05980 [Limnobacter sp.]|uniref:hypothetical protein n=1 Tax=Limnobacter sp. TaxID=2003368 RepID=UPI003919F7EF